MREMHAKTKVMSDRSNKTVPGIGSLSASVLILALLVSVSACSTPHRLSKVADPPTFATPPPYDGSQSEEVRASLRQAYARWRGTPHKMGGTDRNGVDCSGFVRAVFRDTFQIYLPRTTAQQLSAGMAVRRQALRPGDLVFFRPPGYPRHVGIYLSQDKFLHASKSQGVTVSTIDRHYWEPYFYTARRVLPSH